MNRLVRIWIVLAIAYAAGKLVVELGTIGGPSPSLGEWLAVPVIAACQAAVLALVTRRTSAAETDR